MEGKKDSGVLAQMKRTVEAIWAGKHYILAWGMFFTWLYLLGYSMDTFLSDSGFGKAIFLIIMIISIIVFVSFHNEVKENIDNNGVFYYSVVVSLLIVVVFFNAEPDDSGVFSQPTLANFGTFFGGILTPIGILAAIFSLRESIEERRDSEEEKDIRYAVSFLDFMYEKMQPKIIESGRRSTLRMREIQSDLSKGLDSDSLILTLRAVFECVKKVLEYLDEADQTVKEYGDYKYIEINRNFCCVKNKIYKDLECSVCFIYLLYSISNLVSDKEVEVFLRKT